jgi:hypothetical protein
MRFVPNALVLSALLAPSISLAQTQSKEKIKQQIAASTCECLDKKLAAQASNLPLSQEEAQQALTQCMMGAAGKNLTGIQAAYGSNAFSNGETMRQMGREVAGVMMQSCPNFTTISLAMTSSSPATSTAATIGQTVGKLGPLRGPGVGMLELQISPTEKAEFAWLHRFAAGNELLPDLGQLQGKQVRVSWQEVELLQPDTKQYRRVREITGLSVL